jgi:cytochrome c oxidase subunit 3
VVVATNGSAEWKPFTLPAPVWVSTVLILLSSLIYHFAERSFEDGNQSAARKYLLGTTVLGAAFISSQILAWLALVKRGLYIAGNPYAGFFYMLTVLHAVHVLGGVIALGSIILRSWLPTLDDDELVYRRDLARSVGWYWHFVGALWIVLLSLLAFWQ